jgi:hypothetical protein
VILHTKRVELEEWCLEGKARSNHFKKPNPKKT